jgi:hypothetical protein
MRHEFGLIPGYWIGTGDGSLTIIVMVLVVAALALIILIVYGSVTKSSQEHSRLVGDQCPADSFNERILR